jgi:hypothetical protein
VKAHRTRLIIFLKSETFDPNSRGFSIYEFGAERAWLDSLYGSYREFYEKNNSEAVFRKTIRQLLVDAA